MPDRISSARLKVERAQDHLQAIDNEWRSFSDRNPYRIRRVEYDPQTGMHTFAVRLDQQPPDSIRLGVGDWAHCLRSALDHIAWEFTTVRDRRTTFPIYVDPAAQGLTEHRPRFPEVIWEQIEAVQPYRGAEPYNAHSLWVVNELDRIDKHRNILIHGHRLYVPTGLDSPQFMFLGNIARLDEGDVVLRIRPIGDPDANFQPRITAEIRFDMEGPPWSVRLADLRAVQQFVRDEVLPRFAEFK